MRSREPSKSGGQGRRLAQPADSARAFAEDPEHLLRMYADEMDLRSLLLDEMSDGIMAHTLDGEILYFNRAASERTGFTCAEFSRLGRWEWVPAEMHADIPERNAALREQGELRFESHGTSRAGVQVHNEIVSRVIDSPYGPIVLSVMRDIAGRVTIEERIRYLAFHDNLTDLANRAMFDEDLRDALSHSARRSDLVGVVFLDLDDFKPINDRLGHAVGDRALQLVADRLTSCVRDGDTVARLGGDEFLILFRHLACRSDLAAAARKLVEAVAEPVSIGGEEIRLTASAGLAIHIDGEAPEALVTRADNAMYRAKHEGVAGWDVFLRDE
jgi:diguanylate cyclase (GGDEF)-like protein/PAS domain S-box-containing protein